MRSYPHVAKAFLDDLKERMRAFELALHIAFPTPRKAGGLDRHPSPPTLDGPGPHFPSRPIRGEIHERRWLFGQGAKFL